MKERSRWRSALVALMMVLVVVLAAFSFMSMVADTGGAPAGVSSVVDAVVLLPMVAVDVAGVDAGVLTAVAGGALLLALWIGLGSNFASINRFTVSLSSRVRRMLERKWRSIITGMASIASKSISEVRVLALGLHRLDSRLESSGADFLGNRPTDLHRGGLSKFILA